MASVFVLLEIKQTSLSFTKYVSNSEFTRLLSISDTYLQLSFEDAGIPCMKALKLCRKVLYFRNSASKRLLLNQTSFSLDYNRGPQLIAEDSKEDLFSEK